MTVAREKIIEACAQAAHYVNKAYCEAIGDMSQPIWELAPEWQKTSALKGVDGVLAGNTPEQSHESWLIEKKETGWKYGLVKNPETKEHPCFVPYAELPPEQRTKDSIFVTIVRTVARALGAEIKGNDELKADPDANTLIGKQGEIERLEAAVASLEEQLAAAKQTAEAAVRRERIGLATAPAPRARRP
jgi:hypothetical protein